MNHYPALKHCIGIVHLTGRHFVILSTMLISLSTAMCASNKPTTPTGFVYSDLFLKHDTGAGHVERPERLTSIINHLKQQKIFPELTIIQPTPAPLEAIQLIHTPDYIQRVKKICLSGNGFVDSSDTPVSQDSYSAALLAAGGAMAAVDAVMSGRVRNAFCAVRPPGHHALKDKGMGFCLFNNVAIAARHIQQKHKLPKVLIVDWDVHHGNGTQAAFYDDASVFYFSIHQTPAYPNSGFSNEIGVGKGTGFTLNAPMPPGSGDAEYQHELVKKLKPAALKFQPDFVLISAGFDASQGDLLGRMKISLQGFAELTQVVKDIADQHCRGRLVSILEGGYNLEALAAAVESHLRVLGNFKP
jgi:acetoin utilization deacetylase AcuC-like enzyme